MSKTQVGRDEDFFDRVQAILSKLDADEKTRNCVMKLIQFEMSKKSHESSSVQDYREIVDGEI